MGPCPLPLIQNNVPSTSYFSLPLIPSHFRYRRLSLLSIAVSTATASVESSIPSTTFTAACLDIWEAIVLCCNNGHGGEGKVNACSCGFGYVKRHYNLYSFRSLDTASYHRTWNRISVSPVLLRTVSVVPCGLNWVLFLILLWRQLHLNDGVSFSSSVPFLSNTYIGNVNKSHQKEEGTSRPNIPPTKRKEIGKVSCFWISWNACTKAVFLRNVKEGHSSDGGTWWWRRRRRRIWW